MDEANYGPRNIGDPEMPDKAKQKSGKSISETAAKDTSAGVTLRGWAISAISAVAVLSAVGTASFTVYGKYKAATSEVVAKSEQIQVLSSQKDTLDQQLQPIAHVTQKAISEADKHRRSQDRFVTFPIDQDPEVVVAEYYPSDGCIHISRKSVRNPVETTKSKGKVLYGENIQDYWIPDPAHQMNASANPALTSPNNDDTKAFVSYINRPKLNEADFIFEKGALAQPALTGIGNLQRVEMFQGTCLNPHPGTFQIRNQQVNACEVQVWRTFADRCTHYQMYNACTGQWAPGVNWTFCNNQHRW